jgi:hypothetical protein
MSQISRPAVFDAAHPGRGGTAASGGKTGGLRSHEEVMAKDMGFDSDDDGGRASEEEDSGDDGGAAAIDARVPAHRSAVKAPPPPVSLSTASFSRALGGTTSSFGDAGKMRKSTFGSAEGLEVGGEDGSGARISPELEALVRQSQDQVAELQKQLTTLQSAAGAQESTMNLTRRLMLVRFCRQSSGARISRGGPFVFV